MRVPKACEPKIALFESAAALCTLINASVRFRRFPRAAQSTAAACSRLLLQVIRASLGRCGVKTVPRTIDTVFRLERRCAPCAWLAWPASPNELILRVCRLWLLACSRAPSGCVTVAVIGAPSLCSQLQRRFDLSNGFSTQLSDRRCSARLSASNSNEIVLPGLAGSGCVTPANFSGDCAWGLQCAFDADAIASTLRQLISLRVVPQAGTDHQRRGFGLDFGGAARSASF